MIRTLAILLALLPTPAFAIATGDFECLSDLNGPDTYHGTMRIEDESGFAWLDPDTATPGPVFPMQVHSELNIDFDQAFTDQIAPGAYFMEAAYYEDSFSYEAMLMLPDRLVIATCTYVY